MIEQIKEALASITWWNSMWLMLSFAGIVILTIIFIIIKK